MKNVLKLSAAMAAITLPFVSISPANAAAEESHGLYVSLAGGIAANNEVSAGPFSVQLDDGYSLAGEVGYDFGMLRIGAEARRLSATTSIGLDVKTDATTLMANAYLEPFALGKLEPYAMVGYGKIDAEASALIFSGSADGNAYQYGAGVNYPLTSTLSLDAGWRHVVADDLGPLDFQNDVFQLGLKLSV